MVSQSQLYQQGKKINGKYFVIRASQEDELSITYSVFSKNHSKQFTERVSLEDAHLILGTPMDVSNEVHHTQIVESLHFEDRLKGSEDAENKERNEEKVKETARKRRRPKKAAVIKFEETLTEHIGKCEEIAQDNTLENIKRPEHHLNSDSDSNSNSNSDSDSTDPDMPKLNPLTISSEIFTQVETQDQESKNSENHAESSNSIRKGCKLGSYYVIARAWVEDSDESFVVWKWHIYESKSSVQLGGEAPKDQAIRSLRKSTDSKDFQLSDWLDSILERQAAPLKAAIERAMISRAQAQLSKANEELEKGDFLECAKYWMNASDICKKADISIRAAEFQLEAGLPMKSLSLAKKSILLLRKHNEESLSGILESDNSVSEWIAQAYEVVGRSFLAMNKPNLAMNPLSLAIKEMDSPARRDLLSRTLQLQAVQSTDGVPDMEDFVSTLSVLSKAQSFKFECTMCGECCRSADYLFLSPYDLWRMVRAPSLRVLKISTLTQLRKYFPEALKYTLRNNTPVCFLRPAKNSAGRCSFSYPLSQTKEGDLVQPDNYLQKKREKFIRRSKGGYESSEDEDERPLHPSEYNLTEEEERMYLENPSKCEEDEVLARSDSDDEDVPQPVMNSYNRQALGCLFGTGNMPAICSSYPMARELSWVDMWHDYEVELSIGKSKKQERETNEHFVVVKHGNCEGFYEDGKERTMGSTSAREQTVDQFLNRNHLEKRWVEQDWFMDIFRQVEQAKIKEILGIKMLHDLVVQRLCTIWYDFDTKPAWKDVKQRIVNETSQLLRIIDSFLKEMDEEEQSNPQLQLHELKQRQHYRLSQLLQLQRS